MTFKPGKPVKNDLSQLRVVLNQTGTSLKNNPLYQFLNSLLEKLTKDREVLLDKIAELEDQIDKLATAIATKKEEGKEEPAPLSYVPVNEQETTGEPAEIIDDGYGNPILIPYEP